MSKRRKKRKYSIGDYMVWASLTIILLWIVKILLRVDPIVEIAAVPWVGVAFGAGGVYTEIKHLAKEVERLSARLSELGERVAKLEGALQAR